jgi:hypothetical protein
MQSSCHDHPHPPPSRLETHLSNHVDPAAPAINVPARCSPAHVVLATHPKPPLLPQE